MILFFIEGLVLLILSCLCMFYFFSRRMTEQQLNLLLALTDLKDSYTASHSNHVMLVSELIYEHLPSDIKKKVKKKKLLKAARLHDIGKLYVSSNILLKEDKLTAEEFEEMKMHTLVGEKVLSRTTSSDLGLYAKTHHERHDGKGYWGFYERQIPLESKIIGCADTYSAMVTVRPYRKTPKTIPVAREEIRSIAGTQLDPMVVEAFLRIDVRKLVSVDMVLHNQYRV